MWRLDQEQLVVLFEIAGGLAQELAGWGMVGIEDGDQFAGRVLKAVVEVASLGVFVARPGKIMDAELLAERG